METVVQLPDESGIRPRLADITPLWRYVSLQTLFYYLSGCVFLPSVEKLQQGDPFEGNYCDVQAWFERVFTKRYGEKEKVVKKWIEKNYLSPAERNYLESSKHLGDYRSNLLQDRYFEFISKTRFAWCWFESKEAKEESAAMWNIYGNRGVAIQTTVGQLYSALKAARPKQDFLAARMQYVDFGAAIGSESGLKPERDDQIFLRPFFIKRIEYESENEVRFVTYSPDKSVNGGIVLKEIQPRDWISAIRLWPRLPDNEANALTKVINRFVDVDCRKSNLLRSQETAANPTDDIKRMFGKCSLFDVADTVPAKLKEV